MWKMFLAFLNFKQRVELLARRKFLTPGLLYTEELAYVRNIHFPTFQDTHITLVSFDYLLTLRCSAYAYRQTRVVCLSFVEDVKP